MDNIYYLFENKLKTNTRNSLPDSEFGIESLRKYPLHDKAHVLSAIRMFNYVDKKYEKELAMKIIDKMEYYNIPKETVSEKNRLYKYIH